MSPFVGPDCEAPRVTFRVRSLLGGDIDNVVTGRVCLDLARIAWLSRMELRQSPVEVSAADEEGNSWKWNASSMVELLRGLV